MPVMSPDGSSPGSVQAKCRIRDGSISRPRFSLMAGRLYLPEFSRITAMKQAGFSRWKNPGFALRVQTAGIKKEYRENRRNRPVAGPGFREKYACYGPGFGCTGIRSLVILSYPPPPEGGTG